ncbi:hypothetical protein ACVDG5_018835 [Mesorhizobium sp. ORM6]
MDDETNNETANAISRRGAFALAGKLGLGAAGLAGGLAGAALPAASLLRRQRKHRPACRRSPTSSTSSAT